MNILITGAAGFIGFHLAKKLLTADHEVVGIDNLNSYYDVFLKQSRLEELEKFRNFYFYRGGIEDRDFVNSVYERHRPEITINLAAQAGVRYSIENPHAYIDSNVMGFLNILEACRNFPVKHLVYASSSSVYGGNSKIPFAESDNVDHPVSLYAATKKGNELMAHCYSHLYDIPCTGLRFFTVYGPWGRPDMAYFKFTKAILAGNPIDVYNNGDMERDFTYIDDVVEGIEKVMPLIPETSPSGTRYCIYNIGNNKPVKLMEFIQTIEEATEKKAEKLMLPMQPGDVPRTFADIDKLHKDTGFSPSTTLKEGIGRFVEWYRWYYGI